MQMLFWELIINKLVNDSKNNNYGRAAVICNASPLFSGGAKSGESNIRKWLFEHDYVEAIIQFCPELFYNTGISIYAFIFNMKKSEKRKGKIQLINASSFSKRLTKGLGFKRNELTETHISEIVRLYKEFDKKENSQFVKVLDKKDFYYKEVPCYQPFQRTFQLSSEGIKKLYGMQAFKKLYNEDTFNELDELSSKTSLQIKKMESLLEGKKIKQRIINVLSSKIDSNIFYNRNEFKDFIVSLLPELKDKKTLLKSVVLSFSEDDDAGDKYFDKKGNVEADNDLKDYEIIPYKMDIDEYYEKEVKPFIIDAWLEKDEEKINIGCEINFNKYFYQYKQPEDSNSILHRLKKLDAAEVDLEDKLYGRK